MLTRLEVEELSRDPAWWEDVLARIADGVKLRELSAENCWSWGALWRWIESDAQRVKEYEAALRAYGQKCAMEVVPLADEAKVEEVALAKLRVDTRMKVAEKVDRGRWGEKGGLGGGMVPVLVIEVNGGEVRRDAIDVPSVLVEGEEI